MYIASIFTEGRILFSLNHVEFGNIAPMFTEGRILFFNNVEFQNKVLFSLKVVCRFLPCVQI